MLYITNTDIERRLGSAAYVQLTDDDGDGSADVGVVDEARLAAEGAVNSFLAKRYSVPVNLVAHSELADLLASVTLDLAEYRLRARRPPIPESAERLHNQAMGWLMEVAEGTIDLPAATPVASNVTRGTIAAVTGEARLLTRDELSRH
jgi:phage gp36-like protein